MTSYEIKKIIDGLSKPEETDVFYNIYTITNSKYAYVEDYWMKNRNKYNGEQLIAILVPKKMLSDATVYFLENGVIVNEKYISYNNIVVVGTCDFFHNQNYKDDYIICYGDEKICMISKKRKTVRFACDVIDAIIDEKNALYDSNKKINYYLGFFDEYGEEKVSEIIIYKKISQMTQDTSLIEKLVKKYGYAEYSLKYSESKKKRYFETYKAFPKELVHYMTIFMKKKADKSINEQYCKMYENILSDCSLYLKLIQDCNQIDGYKAYIEIYYSILVYASQSQKELSANLIYKFNSVIGELKNKIENGMIEIPHENNFEYLSMIKYVSDIYIGEIIVPSNSSKIVNEYNLLKNTDKAYYWLNLYVNQFGSDNTVEYADVMFRLGKIYMYGTGTIVADESQMLECFKKAANNNCPAASKFLAEYYTKSNSEDKDKWIQLARDNGQKVKDKRSINEKMKEIVGINISEAAEVVEDVTGIGRNIAGIMRSLGDSIETVGSIAADLTNSKADLKEAENRSIEADRNAERGRLEHEQYLEGQKVKNKQAKANNMKAERKADKAIAKEEKRR